MENKSSDFDNLFRKNISDYELSEAKGNWKLLNLLLNEQERKKKNRKMILFFFSFFMLISTGVFIMLHSNEKKEMTIINSEKSHAITHSSAIGTSSENKNTQSEIVNQSQKNESIKFTEKNSKPIKHENISSRNEEENTKQNLPPSAINPSIVRSHHEVVQPINTNPEINVSQQPNIVFNDSDKTLLPETEISKSLLYNDSIPSNANTNEIVNENLIAPDTINSITKNDSLFATANNIPSVDSAAAKEKHPVHSKILNFNFYAGINIYSTSSAAHANQEHLSPIIGFEFLLSLTSHFNIGLGTLYSLQGGYHLSDTASQENYFLEKNTSQQAIHIHQLHKLYFPLTLYYTVAAKHSISAGVQLSYLVNTKGDFNEINNVSGSVTESNKNNVAGYMDGIKSTNYCVSLGYKFALSKRFDWTTRITHELSDSYTKEYFYGVNTKPSFSFQTFLIVKF